jgi:hypothetical protein
LSSPFDQLTLSAANYPTLTKISSFTVASSMVSAFTAFQLTSAADTAPVPEMASAWLLLLGLGLSLVPARYAATGKLKRPTSSIKSSA